MEVLIACEFSGIVREEFKKRGHDAWSCDLLETEVPGQHIKGDVLDYIDNNPFNNNEGWDLIIAHPPCTYLANSGVCWLYKQMGRYTKMCLGAKFFKKLLNAPCDKIVVENPIPHKYAVEIIGSKYNQIIHPYMFGHKERKATCLWLKGVDKLKETNNVKTEMEKLPKNKQQRIHYLPPSRDRWKERSKTFKGIAKAMAEQWG